MITTTYYVKSRIASEGDRSALYNITFARDGGDPLPAITIGSVMAFPDGTMDYFNEHGNPVSEVTDWLAAIVEWRKWNPGTSP